MSETPPPFPETLPLVDELVPAEQSGDTLTPPYSGTAITPESSPIIRPEDSQPSVPEISSETETAPATDTCPAHKIANNLICLDPMCSEFRRLLCPECNIEIHADCQKEQTLDVENFARMLKQDSSKLKVAYARFNEIMAARTLEFNLRAIVEDFIAAEDQAVGRVTWQDFKQPNPQFVLELKEGSISLYSQKLGVMAQLFEKANAELSAATMDELFGTTLVAFEKALINELSLEPQGDVHQGLHDNIDMYSSSFSKKNYSDDSQVLEAAENLSVDASDPQAFNRSNVGGDFGVKVFEEDDVFHRARKRHASETTNLKADREKRKKDGRKAGPSKSLKGKPPKVVEPPKPVSPLAAPFKDSKIVKEGDFQFMESFLTKDFIIDPIYCSETHGLSAEAFHKNCDNIGPTLVLVKTEHGVAGGWTDKSWSSPDNGSYQRSNNSFLFSLTKQKVYKIKLEEKRRAVFSSKYMGPCFGDDLVISGLILADESYSRLGTAFEDGGADKPYEELFKTHRFVPQVVEVYKCVNSQTLTRQQIIVKATQDSTIILAEHQTYLSEILGDISGMSVLFRSKNVNYTPQLFHDVCDNQGPTLTVIKANGAVGGGFTDIDWESTGGYKNSEKSFIFSLTKRHVFPQKEHSHGNAIFCRREDGPNFGDRDLYISNDLKTKTNRTYLGSYYDASHVENPKGFIFGEEYFEIEEFEVYSVEL